MFNKSIVLAAAIIVAGGLALSAPASAGHHVFMPPMGGDMGRMGEFHHGGGDGWRRDHDHFGYSGPAYLRRLTLL